ncbi:MAG TPA: TetR/AcrR family transcriptional regulator [Agromyces sp.]|jgi:AcrR family transcriptional regulator|nr:TetR/AcrR family transcriptional regulator [Agromyces sp.]
MARRGSYAKGVAKREEILTAALEVIARRGYGRTSVRELADAVGLSQAGLLHYFSSKEELFAEVLRKRDEVDRAALDSVPRGDDSEGDRFVRTIRHNADVPGLVQLYARLSSEATEPEHPARGYFEEHYRGLRGLTSDTIRDGQAAGTIRDDVDADQAASLLLAVADGLQTQWLMDPSIDMAEHVEAFLRLLERPVADGAAVPAPAEDDDDADQETR